MLIKFRVPSSSAETSELLDGFIKKLSEADELLLSKIDAKLKNHKHKHKISNYRFVSVEIDDALFIKLRQRFTGNRLQKILEVAYLIIIITHFRRNELEYGKILFKANEGWKREVRTKSGNIDGLNRKLCRVVELKFVEGWKGALGQILAYVETDTYLAKYSKEIWLICRDGVRALSKSKQENIEETCGKFGVKVFYIEGDLV